MLKDHLGNTRATIKQDGTIVQVQDYYAFGLEMNANNQVSPSPNNQYKYNGKELNNELGLDSYDYGARFYDPVVGRWNVVDPLAEKAEDWSPYRYGFNNPVIYTDPTGMFESRKEAREYRREHDVHGSIVRGNDGSFSINDTKNSMAYFRNTSDIQFSNQDEKGIVSSPLITATRLNGSNENSRTMADYVGLADALGGPVGNGAENVLKHRGTYLPRNEIYNSAREIILRTPMANIQTTSRVLNYARIGGKVLGAASIVATGSQVLGDINDGRYYSATARTAVAAVAAGSAFIPFAGWGVAAGIGVADYVWGDQFYNYVERTMK